MCHRMHFLELQQLDHWRNGCRPELQQNIVPGCTSHRGTAPVRPNSIQICDGSASRSEFQERISHDGNTPRLQLQNFSQSVTSTNLKLYDGNMPGPSNSAKMHGGNVPGPSAFNQAGGSRTSSYKVGTTALTSSAILKSADEVVQNNPDLCTPSNVKPLTTIATKKTS